MSNFCDQNICYRILMLISENQPSKMKLFGYQEIFFWKWCRNEFKDANEKSCR